MDYELQENDDSKLWDSNSDDNDDDDYQHTALNQESENDMGQIDEDDSEDSNENKTS